MCLGVREESRGFRIAFVQILPEAGKSGMCLVNDSLLFAATAARVVLTCNFGAVRGLPTSGHDMMAAQIIWYLNYC